MFENIMRRVAVRRAEEDSRNGWNDWKDYDREYTYPKGKGTFSESPEGNRYGRDMGNMILGEKTRLNMCTSQGSGTGLTDNVLVMAAPGTGKAFRYETPNILQMNSSYVITDPGGEMLIHMGQMLINHGYRIRVLNLTDMLHSCRYNPFKYIRKDEDAIALADAIMLNTDDCESGKGDRFFVETEKQLLLALIYYIHYEMPPEEQTMETLLDLLREAEVHEWDKDIESPLDRRFAALEKKNRRHAAVIYYKWFKAGAGRSIPAFTMSVNTRLAPFTIKAVRDLTSDDDMELDEIGNSRYAVFVVTKIDSGVLNFISAMMYTQLIGCLYESSRRNRKSWLLKKGPTVALSEFCGSEEPEQLEAARKRLEEKREKYLAAELKVLDEKDQYAGNRAVLVTKDGEILKKFMGYEEANRFIDALKNGEIARPEDLYLPSHVRIMMDDFANTCEIPNFLNILSTSRKYSISYDIMVQSFDEGSPHTFFFR